MKLITKIQSFIKKKINFYTGIKKAKQLGICFYKPNYIYLPKINENSVIVDVGCADDPDYSIHIMETHGSKTFGVDPTRKHFQALKQVEKKYNGKFVHLPYAVVNKSGKLVFHESKAHASGSVLNDHVNVKKDDVVSYEVEALSIEDLKKNVGSKIDILKLDLEGAEYELLSNITSSDLNNIDQIFVEFHHHCIDSYSIMDTNKLVKKIEQIGFKVFTLDYHNYLFYR